jgi:flagella basal body P-ring formation protein FlgA
MMLRMLSRLAVALALAALPQGGPLRADTMVEVPVLIAAVGLGDVIDEADIEIVELPYGKIPRNAITDPAGLIGMTPKRLLRPGIALREGDVAPPVVVKRNTVVVMVFERGGLFLTAKGKTLQDGGAGEVIRIENLQSGIVVQGVVQADGHVEVGFGDSFALN